MQDPTTLLRQQYRAIRLAALELEGVQRQERFISGIRQTIAMNAQQYSLDPAWQKEELNRIHAAAQQIDEIEALTNEERALTDAIAAAGLPDPESLSIAEAPSLYRAKIDPGATVASRSAWSKPAIYAIACQLAKRLDTVSAKSAPIVSTDHDGDLLIDFQKRSSARQFPRFRDRITPDWIQANKGRWLFVSGVMPDGELMVLDRRKNGQQSTLRAGKNGSGKSMQELVDLHLNTLLLTPDELHLYVADPHAELAPYEGLPHLHGRKIETTAIGALRIAVAIEREMMRRLALLKQHGVNDIDKLPVNARLPYIQFVIDEFSGLCEDLDQSFDAVVHEFPNFYKFDENGKLLSRTNPSTIFLGRLSKLAKQGRKAGIGIDLTEQTPKCDVLPSAVKNELIAQCFRVKTATASRVIIDECGGENLLGNGDSLVLTSDGLTRVQGLFLSDEDMLPLREKCTSARPSAIASTSILPDYWETPGSTGESGFPASGKTSGLPAVVAEYLENTPSETVENLADRVRIAVAQTSKTKALNSVFGVTGGRRYTEWCDAIEYLLKLGET